jgi:uncharacterized SAM-binding protein YcdF (DUF218 family)
MYRLLGDLADPAALLLLATALLLVRLWRKGAAARGTARALLVAALLVTLLYLPAVGYLLLGSLEWDYPPRAERPEGVEAIVVLGGYVSPPPAEGMPAELAEDSLLRCLRAADLYRQGPPCPVIVTGGPVHPDASAPPVARAMRDFLVAQGVEASHVVVEDRSRSTHENAVETAKVLRDLRVRKVALVTDAAHLRRALGCFRAQGVNAVGCGCRYRAAGRLTARDFLPDLAADAARRTAAHEWVGIAWYKIQRRM